MAKPITRNEFKAYCLRRLGDGAIDVNVTDDQVNDRIDDAVSYWWDYHYDGTEYHYFKHQIIQQDIDNGYIDVPEEVIGVVDIFPLESGLSTSQFHSDGYQYLIREMQSLSGFSLTNAYFTRARMEEIDSLLSSQPPIRFNRHTDKLYIDADWEARFSVGDWVVARAYKVLPDDDTVADVWSDRWLMEYATVLIELQWGTNLTKFEGMTMPGGMTFNGSAIYDRALNRKKELEEEMINNYSMPLLGEMG